MIKISRYVLFVCLSSLLFIELMNQNISHKRNIWLVASLKTDMFDFQLPVKSSFKFNVTYFNYNFDLNNSDEVIRSLAAETSFYSSCDWWTNDFATNNLQENNKRN